MVVEPLADIVRNDTRYDGQKKIGEKVHCVHLPLMPE
jgi:hypothetical protein